MNLNLRSSKNLTDGVKGIVQTRNWEFEGGGFQILTMQSGDAIGWVSADSQHGGRQELSNSTLGTWGFDICCGRKDSMDGYCYLSNACIL